MKGNVAQAVTIRPTRQGRDLTSRDRKYDAHVRLETMMGERLIAADVFDSRIVGAKRAHLESDSFPATVEGAREATDFLRNYGFAVRVVCSETVR